MTKGPESQRPKGRPRGGSVLSLGRIEELKRAGLSQSDIARIHGTSRQAVSWHIHEYNGTLRPRDRVLREHWPFEMPTAMGDASIARRLRDHAEWFITGGVGMSTDSLRRLAGMWKRLHRNGFVVEFDPALPPAPRLSAAGGWAYRPRQASDGELMIRVNEHCNLTNEGRLIWRLPSAE